MNRRKQLQQQRKRQLPPDDSTDDVFTGAAADDDEEGGCSADNIISGPQDRKNVTNEVVSSPSKPIDNYEDDKDLYRDDDCKSNELQALHRGAITQSNFTKRCLTEDTFSFVIYCHVQSRAFILATLVFSLQIAIFIILAVDIIDVSNKKNPLALPANVETPVRITELIAIVIAIITQDDVRKAVNLLREGFNTDLPKAFQGATVVKWILSIILRASQGCFGLFITFLLIMQSSTVLELLLNFSAMEFVTLLDDVVFSLTSEGFLGKVLKEEAKRLSNTFYHVSHHAAESDSRTAKFFTAAYFVVLFTIMYSGWGIIFEKQARGAYLCDEIFVQFGDELLPLLGTLTGLLHRRKLTFGGRLSYRDDRDGGPLLAYCLEDKRWTISLTTDDIFNPCNWHAASSESKDFDVLSTADSPWIVKTTKKRVVPLTQHFLQCHDCMNINNFCGEFGQCVGIKDKDKCKCGEGHYGLRCEYPEPCAILEIDPRDSGFIKGGGDFFASKYYRLEGVETYNHPVYTSIGDSRTLTDGTDIILFTGVRWVLSYKNLFPGLENINDLSGLVEYFSQFHSHFTEYEASFVSEPVYIDTLEDDTADPWGLRWLPAASMVGGIVASNLQQRFVEASFFCASCNNVTNPCSYGAVCLSNGSCGDCPNESSGTMCQIPPISNGKCNPYFNNMNFGFDGGDCCDSTCRSTHENICGKAGQGYIDSGYPKCIIGSNQWKLSGEPIFGLTSASRSGLAIALSGNGAILAVGDPGVSIVRLFDKEGSEWIQRGQDIIGPPDVAFGTAVDLSDESSNITRNPLTYPTVTLAVGARDSGLVRVYKCSTVGCIQRGGDIVGGKGFGRSLSIAKDGDSIAIGGTEDSSSFNHVRVLTWSNGNWRQKGNVTIATPYSSRTLQISLLFLPGYYVSLSGDYLAVGTLEGSVFSTYLTTQVFRWESGWVQLGDDIKKQFYVDESFREQWPLKGPVVKDGVLAIGSKSSVDVFSWNQSSFEWIPREIQLNSSDKDGLVGWSIDLSEDASVLAIATSVENPTETDESIRMYRWDGNTYEQFSNGVPGGPVGSVSLSSNGKAVAVGLPFSQWSGGSTRVYSFHPSSPCKNASQIPLRISFTTDANPDETSWELRVDSEVKRSSGSLSGYMYTSFVEEMCIPADSCVKFIVYDAQGDGINPPGVFSVMLNGTELVRGGDFEFYNVTSIGNCKCSEDKVPFALIAATDYDSDLSLMQHDTLSQYTQWKLGYGSLVTGSFSTLVVDECIPNDCYYLSLKPSAEAFTNCPGDFCVTCTVGNEFVNYTATFDGNSIVSQTFLSPPFCPEMHKFGECSTTSPARCGDGSILVKIKLTLGEKPFDTIWTLNDLGAGNSIEDKGGPYELRGDGELYFGKGAIIRSEICKPVDSCYNFRINATDDANAVIFHDGKISYANRTNAAVYIGDSCPPPLSPGPMQTPEHTPSPTP